MQKIPEQFTYLNDPRIILSLDYLTTNNFIGRPLPGYIKPVCIITKPAAKALIAVQDELDRLETGYVLKIFDTYRPTTTVDEFLRWSQDLSDQAQKAKFYPNINKADLFKLGYLVARSSHSRGSTVDLTLVNANTKQELDMGTIFDFFGEESHTDSKLISVQAQQNRQFFKSLMAKHGFTNLPEEWWHYTLEDEPFPDTYFDFEIK